jgi:phosphoglycerate dehydrogenase-like enzyme
VWVSVRTVWAMDRSLGQAEASIVGARRSVRDARLRRGARLGTMRTTRPGKVPVRFVVPDNFPPVYADDSADLELLRARGEVAVYSTRATSADELAERLRGAIALVNVRAYSTFDDALLARLPDLKLIAIQGTGTDNIDLESATRRGVAVCNTPGANALSVAEMTIGLMFDAVKGISLMERRLRAGEWYHVRSFELRGKTIGLVGLGVIGQYVAEMARGLGMRVISWSYNQDPERARKAGAELVELDTLLRESDVVSLHLRNSPKSAGIIGQAQLKLMKPSAVLVNTARGALVDTDALVAALRDKTIAAAGLDVYTTEPLPLDSPLRTLENVVLTPHAGWVTNEASARLERLPVENIIAFLDGHPNHIVNPAVLERK